MNVLIAFGSKRGGTAGLAAMIGECFLEHGDRPDVLAAGKVRSIDQYDVVVVAGALYMNRWHRDARRFVRRHAKALAVRPVWFVCSGPLDDSAETKDLPPVAQVAALMAKVGARGQVTFGGCLAADAKGFPASSMAKTRAGDWRNGDHVRAWVGQLKVQLASIPVASS